MEVPPWLDVGPRDFAAAKEAGMKAQLERASLAQSAQQAAQQLGLERERLAASERQAAREALISQEQIKANFARSQTQIAVAQAYHNATLGLAKNRLDLEGAKLQQTVQAQNAALTERAKQAAGKPDPYKLEQYKTLQSAYLDAVKNYEKQSDRRECPDGPQLRRSSQTVCPVGGHTCRPGHRL